MQTLGSMLEASEAGCNPFVLFNRECRPEPTCFVSPACRAVALGEACFETFRMDSNGRVIGFEAHLQRLKRGASTLGFDPERHHPSFDFSAASVARELLELREKWAQLKRSSKASATRFETQDFRIRIQLGRADSSGIYDDAPENAAFFSLVRMFTAGPPAKPAKLWISSARRIPAETIRQDVKWSFYVPNVQLLARARAHGADDALLLDGDGNISEAATANVFFFIDDALVTPPPAADALAGITRAEVIKAAEAGGIPVEQRRISPQEARGAQAGFITNSMRGISPVESIDGASLSMNHSGLRRVMKIFRAHTQHTATDLASYQA
ncbi:MAG: aminotransferase class IV [Cyclonatronaceae bacterium]